MKYLMLYENYSSLEDYDETYKNAAERTFYDIDDHFHYDMRQFFPLKVTLEEYKGKYDLTIALGLGWITRMSDEDIEWLSDYVYDLNSQFEKDDNFYAAFMGDGSRSGSRKVWTRANDNFPKDSMDYMDMPPGRYPDRG